MNDKRRREQTPDPHPEEKKEAKSTPKEEDHEETKKDLTKVIVDYKTDYQKKIILQKQKLLKDKIDHRLLTTHR